MNKPVLGLLIGGILGIFDGLSALVSAPETAPQIAGIVTGSVFKGIIAGLLIGWFARKVDSLPLGIALRPRHWLPARASRRAHARRLRQPLLLADHPARVGARDHRRVRDAEVRPESGVVAGLVTTTGRATSVAGPVRPLYPGTAVTYPPISRFR